MISIQMYDHLEIVLSAMTKLFILICSTALVQSW